MANSDLSRWLGGSPGAVVLKLVFMSILVGAFLSLFGLTPPDLQLYGTDLGLTYEHAGKHYIVFGDSWPSADLMYSSEIASGRS